MSNKSSIIKNKYFLYGCCAILAVGIAVGTVFLLRMNSGPSDDFFVSDDTKTVISLEPDSTDTTSTSSVHTHVVYEYDGDLVTGMKTYFEYNSPELASSAFENLKDQPEFKNGEVNGKYIIVTADPESFKGLTASDVQQQAEAIRQYQEQNSKKNTQEEAPKETDSDSDTESEPDEPEGHEETPEKEPSDHE